VVCWQPCSWAGRSLSQLLVSLLLLLKSLLQKTRYSTHALSRAVCQCKWPAHNNNVEKITSSCHIMEEDWSATFQALSGSTKERMQALEELTVGSTTLVLYHSH
jgi:hypothetical protein